MFDIDYKGGNTIVISSKQAELVIDPKLSTVGLKDIVIKDAIELATEARFAVNGPDARLSIEGPGEYGVANLDIRGIAARRHIDTEADALLSTIYRVEVGGDVRIAVVGNVSEELSDDQLEGVGLIDILIVPVGGGGYTLDATSAISLIQKVDPKVVIPVHYADAGLHYEVPQDSVEQFTKTLGVPVETVSKYKVKSSTSLPTELTVVIIERSPSR